MPVVQALSSATSVHLPAFQQACRRQTDQNRLYLKIFRVPQRAPCQTGLTRWQHHPLGCLDALQCASAPLEADWTGLQVLRPSPPAGQHSWVLKGASSRTEMGRSAHTTAAGLAGPACNHCRRPCLVSSTTWRGYQHQQRSRYARLQSPQSQTWQVAERQQGMQICLWWTSWFRSPVTAGRWAGPLSEMRCNSAYLCGALLCGGPQACAACPGAAAGVVALLHAGIQVSKCIPAHMVRHDSCHRMGGQCMIEWHYLGRCLKTRSCTSTWSATLHE